MIWHVIERCKRVYGGIKVILATSDRETDEDLLPITKKTNINWFTGSANDVLHRYYKCALEFHIDPIIRITGDCPLVDIETTDRIIQTYLNSRVDYVRTGMTYPDGLNVEVFSLQALEKASKEAILLSEREHVTPYIWKNSSLFALEQVEFHTDLSHFRLTVDYEEDLIFIRKIFNKLYEKNNFFGFKDVFDLLKNDSSLFNSMPKPKRYEGYKLSLALDKKGTT
jgi:spore coat polysaccharide biosynthesis protein SpsF